MVLRMVKVGFKTERGGGKPIFNEFKIANFTKIMDLVPKYMYIYETVEMKNSSLILTKEIRVIPFEKLGGVRIP